MKSKQQTPLGYLMGLLDVSLADLGDYLYVAQTSISKWKTGARPLKPTSQHFAGIVEYFAMLSRDADRREKLTQLFARLYPEQAAETPEDIATCVRAFLSGKLLPPVTLKQALSGEGRLYTAEIGVYGGDAGSESAFDQLLGLVAAQGEPMPLCAVNRCDPQQIARLLPALARGCRLRLLLDAPDGALPLSACGMVIAHPATDIRMLPEAAPLPRHAAWYLAGKEMYVHGHAPQGHTPYAAVYTDALTVEHMQHDFDAMWQEAVPSFTQIPCERLGAEIYRKSEQATLPEPLDWLTPALPYLTMSRSLLMEVLRMNDVSGRVWTHVLGGCDALAALPLRVFLPASALRTPQAIQPTLSVLCGKAIHMTPAQSKRHLLDTAALLRADALSVLPLQGAKPAGWEKLSAFVKRNAYAGYLNYGAEAVQYTQNAAFTQAMMAAMDALAAEGTQEAHSPTHIAAMMERVALEGA